MYIGVPYLPLTIYVLCNCVILETSKSINFTTLFFTTILEGFISL